MKDLRKHFEHELNVRIEKIPYKDLADEETLNVWFKQFCNVPKIPSFYLYSRKHLTDDEYVNALENNIRLLGKIKDEFHEHLSSRTLDEQYYINDITKTPITKTLYKVSEIRDIFLDRVCYNSVDGYKKPKGTAKDIIRLIEQLPLAFASAIIKNIENEDIDMRIFIMNEYGGENLNREKEYKLKEMNNSLIRHLDKWLKIKSSKEPQKQEKGTKKLQDILLTDKGTAEKIVCILKKKYRNSKGKNIKLILLALRELELIASEENRNAQEFHRCCSECFDWYIGSYQSMSKYEYNYNTDYEFFNKIKKHLKTAVEESL